MTEPFIRFDNVSFSYDEERDDGALKNVSLEIGRGEFVAILGHNGSGKSTLAKHFNGVLVPSQGCVTVDSMSTLDEDKIFDIRRHVGMVFQNPDNQIVATIVEEDVAFAPENLGVPPDEIRKRVDDALKTVGMYEYRRSQPHRLSGGQKQRVAIAGVLAMHPDCIVLDEPTAMLDPQGRRQVMDTIIHLAHDEGITVVLITHYMEEAALCDRVVVMNDGEICLDGTPSDVFSQREKLKEIGLGVPAVTEVCALLNESGVKIPETVISQQKCVEIISGLFKKQ